MARYESGWIKLHRKILRNEVIDDAPALAIWALLLMWAMRKDSQSRIKGQHVTLQRGQVATSPREIASKLKLDKNLVKRRIGDLVDASMVTQQTTQYGTIITIVNYDAYQRKDTKTTQDMNGKRPSRRPHSGEIEELSFGEKEEQELKHHPQTRARARNDRGGGNGDDSGFEMKAQRILNRAVGAIRAELPESEAIAHMGKDGWAALHQMRYPTFAAFSRAYKNAYERATPTIVEGQFRKAIKAALLDLADKRRGGTI